MSTATAVLIENPLQLRERVTLSVPDGSTVAAVLPADWTAAVVRINGKAADEQSIIRTGDFVVAIQRPEGGFVPFLLNLAAAIAVGFAFQLLFPPPKLTLQRDDESSPTYGFSGIQGNRTEGLPVPIVYGKMRVGGTVVNEFLDIVGIQNPTTTLRQLIAFGEGPIKSIGGVSVATPSSTPLGGGTLPRSVFLNGNPIQNFRDVLAWIRLGSNSQEVVPGFNEARTQTTVGQQLISFDVGANEFETFELGAGFSADGTSEFDTTNDALWATNQVSVDLNAEDVDAFIITLNFPQGLYRANTISGGITFAGFRYQVRYIELDAGGAPITSGGYAGDGYVRLPLETVSGDQRNPIKVQARGAFIDPQTYVPALPGKSLFIDSAAPTSGASFAVSSGGYSNGYVVPAFAGMAWVQFSSFGTPAQKLVLIRSQAGNRGFSLEIDTHAFVVGGNQQVLTLRLWDGVGENKYVAFGGGTVVLPPANLAGGLFTGVVDQWTHVGFSHTAGQTPQLFVNGVAIPTIRVVDSGVFQPGLQWTRSPLIIGRNATATGQRAYVDEPQLYTQALTQEDFSAAYRFGEGIPAPIEGLESRNCFRADFEEPSSFSPPTSTFGTPEQWYATTGTNGPATDISAAGLGAVPTGQTGDLKRSKYRVQILRVSKESNLATIGNASEVESIDSVISDSFTYPNSPMIGLQIDASEQVNGGTPNTTAVVEGKLVPVWDGVSTVVPTLGYEWSDNPAWVALDIVLNDRYGLGGYYSASDVDLEQWKAWADYCDEIVFDGTPRITVTNPGSVANADLYFDNSTTDPGGFVRGALWFEIGIEELGTLPTTFEAGRFIRLSLWPTSGTGINNDVNSADGTGYEIYAAQLLDGVWTVKCYWDRLTETDPWTSGSRIGADILTPTSINGAKVEGGERRFRFNGVFDKAQPTWDALLQVCATGRAAPVPVGSRLSLRYSHPRNPVGVITPANIKAGSFECTFSSERTKPNALTLNILDEQQLFEPVPVQVQAPELDSIANQSFVRQENVDLFGVTSAGQAERHGNYILAVNRLQKRAGSFEAALDALPYQVGDLLRVSSEVLPRGAAGRALSSSNSTQGNAFSDREDLTASTWAKTSVTVTGDVSTDPFGDAVADRVDGTGYVSQTADFDRKVKGWYSFSFLVKAGTSSLFSIVLASDRDQALIDYNLTTGAVTSNTDFDTPRRGTLQDMGGGWYYATASFFVKPLDNRVETTALEFRLYPRSGAASGSIEVSKFTATQAQYAATFEQRRGVVIDAPLTIASSTAYTLHLQDFRGNVVSAALDVALTPPGTYAAGDTIWTSTDLESFAVIGSPFLLASADEELVVEVASVTKSPDLSAKFDWVEYNADVYDDDAEESEQEGGRITRVENQRPGPGVEPYAASGLTVTDTLTEPSPGVFQTELAVGWQNSAASLGRLVGAHVYYRVSNTAEPRAGWLLGASVSGAATSARISLPGAATGEVYEVSVVGQTEQFPSLDPLQGARAVVRIRGLAFVPQAPTGLTAELDRLEAAYAVTLATSNAGDSRERPLRAEIRRGGWILGQLVALTDENTLSVVSTNIFEAPSDQTVGRLHCRMLARSSFYGGETTLVPSLAPAATPDVPDIALGASEEWETSQSGSWVVAVPPIEGPFLTGSLEVAAGGYLQFPAASTALSGNYRTTIDATQAISEGQSQQPRPLLIMASVEAEQVHPLTVGLGPAMGSLEMQRWSMEGPTSVSDDDLPNCTLAIEMRVNVTGRSGAWSDWQPFTCGVYDLVDVQLRVRVTRPATTYNVKIKRFHTKVIVPMREITEQGTRDLTARQEIL